jgi:activator of HSP90 ATPase
MNPEFTVGRVTNPVPINGRYYIFKLLERFDKEENLSLESPNVRPQITELLVNSRKQLLSAAYQAVAMNEARIENFLAKKIVDNPNELSGARPAPRANANTAPAANTGATNSAPTGSNTGSAANTAGNSATANASQPAASNTNAARGAANR